MKWIKCSEQMPEEDQKVLIYFPVGNYIETSYIKYYHKDQWRSNSCRDEIWFNEINCCGIEEYWNKNEVTHWMALPDKPIEEIDK